MREVRNADAADFRRPPAPEIPVILKISDPFFAGRVLRSLDGISGRLRIRCVLSESEHLPPGFSGILVSLDCAGDGFNFFLHYISGGEDPVADLLIGASCADETRDCRYHAALSMRVPAVDGAWQLASSCRELWLRSTSSGFVAPPIRDVMVAAFRGLTGGCGTTALCLSSAVMLERIYGIRPLYISLSGGAGAARYFREEWSAEGMDLCLLLQAEPVRPLDRFLVLGGICPHLQAVSPGPLLSDPSCRLIRTLLQKAAGIGRFDLILLDLGTSSGGAADRVFCSADAAVLVEDGRSRPCTAGERVLREHESALRPDLIRVRCFDRENSAPSGGGNDQKGDEGDPEQAEAAEPLSVSDAPEAFRPMGGFVRIDTRGNYGMEVAALAKRIAAGIGRGRRTPVSRGSREMGQGEENKRSGRNAAGR